jgi:hypothetical protein
MTKAARNRRDHDVNFMIGVAWRYPVKSVGGERFTVATVDVVRPDGGRFRTDAPDADDRLSAALARVH